MSSFEFVAWLQSVARVWPLIGYDLQTRAWGDPDFVELEANKIWQSSFKTQNYDCKIRCKNEYLLRTGMNSINCTFLKVRLPQSLHYLKKFYNLFINCLIDLHNAFIFPQFFCTLFHCLFLWKGNIFYTKNKSFSPSSGVADRNLSFILNSLEMICFTSQLISDLLMHIFRTIVKTEKTSQDLYMSHEVLGYFRVSEWLILIVIEFFKSMKLNSSLLLIPSLSCVL